MGGCGSVGSSGEGGSPGDAFAADIVAARNGSNEALNRIFAQCRAYLLMIANQVLPGEIRAKTGASDVVQETFMQVKQNFARFRGASEGELLAWLRGVLLNNVQETARRFLTTGKREARREVSIDQGLSGAERDRLVDAARPSPGSQLVAEEEAARLAAAIEKLPADYRQLIRLRNIEERSFVEIGVVIGRSSDAARKQWARAIVRLKRELLTDPPLAGAVPRLEEAADG